MLQRTPVYIAGMKIADGSSYFHAAMAASPALVPVFRTASESKDSSIEVS